MTEKISYEKLLVLLKNYRDLISNSNFTNIDFRFLLREGINGKNFELDLSNLNLTKIEKDVGRNIFEYANLSNINFENSDMRNLSFIGANFMNCNLKGANLELADLYNCNLNNADLKNTNLSKVDFRNVLHTGKISNLELANKYDLFLGSPEEVIILKEEYNISNLKWIFSGKHTNSIRKEQKLQLYNEIFNKSHHI